MYVILLGTSTPRWAAYNALPERKKTGRFRQRLFSGVPSTEDFTNGMHTCTHSRTHMPRNTVALCAHTITSTDICTHSHRHTHSEEPNHAIL